MEMETPSWKKFKRVRNLPIWGENLPKSFLTRLSLFMDLAAVQRQELVAKITQVSAKNAFVPVKRDNSVNTYSRISTVPRGSERSE